MTDEKRDPIDFEFMGAVWTKVQLDPKEFAGRTVPQVTEEIMKILRDLRPDAEFYPDDAELAAEQLVNG